MVTCKAFYLKIITSYIDAAGIAGSMPGSLEACRDRWKHAGIAGSMPGSLEAAGSSWKQLTPPG